MTKPAEAVDLGLLMGTKVTAPIQGRVVVTASGALKIKGGPSVPPAALARSSEQ